MKTIIVSRHPAAIKWINKYYPDFNGIIKSHIAEDEIIGNRIIGTLPVQLAALAAEYFHLSIKVPAEMRGKELSIEDMVQFGCKIERFTIKKFVRESPKGWIEMTDRIIGYWGFFNLYCAKCVQDSE